MFKKKVCPKCNSLIDGMENTCPKCGEVFKRDKSKVSYVFFWKQLIIFFIGLAGFELIAFVLSIIFASIFKGSMSAADYENFVNTYKLSAIVNFVSYFIVFIALTLALWKDNIKLLKTFKNWKVPVFAIAGFLAIYIFNIAYSNILSLCGVNFGVNDNESGLRKIIGSFPVLSLLIFGLMGPLCEEITYRVGLYSFFRRINKYLAYVITIIVFAFIHFDFTSSDMATELLNLPIYLFAAFTFSHLYERVGFACSASAHVINNLFSITSVIIANLTK